MCWGAIAIVHSSGPLFFKRTFRFSYERMHFQPWDSNFIIFPGGACPRNAPTFALSPPHLRPRSAVPAMSPFREVVLSLCGYSLSPFLAVIAVYRIHPDVPSWRRNQNRALPQCYRKLTSRWNRDQCWESDSERCDAGRGNGANVPRQ